MEYRSNVGRVKPVPVAILATVIIGLVVWFFMGKGISFGKNDNDRSNLKFKGNVKSCTFQTYNVDNKFGEWVPTSLYEGYSSDSYGISYLFDKKGFFTETRGLKNGQVYSVDAYEHQDNRVAEITRYEPPNSLDRVIKFNHISDDHLEITSYDDDGKAFWKTVQKSEITKGLLMKYTEENTNLLSGFNSKQVSEYTYDKKDRILTQKTINSRSDEEEASSDFIKFRYDGEDVVISLKQKDGEGFKPYEKTECIERDDFGNCIKELFYDYFISETEPTKILVFDLEYY